MHGLSGTQASYAHAATTLTQSPSSRSVSGPVRLDPSPTVPLQDKNERARLFSELHAFRLCTGFRPREDRLRFPLRDRLHSPGQPLDGYSHLQKYHALPYRVKFLIVVRES